MKQETETQNLVKKISRFVRLRNILIIVCIILASFCYSCRGHGGTDLNAENPEIPQSETMIENTDNSEATTVEYAVQETLTEESGIYVQICGQVISPGVYEVPEGSRIFEVLDIAGGYTDLAAKEYLNLADTVSDGMKLVVPSITDLKQDELYGKSDLEVSDHTGQKVNLNTATKEELMTLRGIGESKAEDILQYRSSHGRFERIEDIKKISGIKDVAFEKIKDNITV